MVGMTVYDSCQRISNLLTAGMYAQYGILSVQLKPEYVYAPNPDFEIFPLTETNSARLANISLFKHHRFTNSIWRQILQ